MISRFEIKDVLKAESLLNKSERIENEIHKILNVKYYLPLADLLTEFNQNNITLIENDWNRCAAIVRHKTSFFSTCKNPSVNKMYSRIQTELPLIQTIDYANFRVRGLFDDQTCYKIYFFL
uniref:Bro-N domain-containing protein n=1 Tax=Meloidogyne hapla TaxID=6305 RepID=A0A1I8BVZ5_MELHA